MFINISKQYLLMFTKHILNINMFIKHILKNISYIWEKIKKIYLKNYI